jgi:hypothetical protein
VASLAFPPAGIRLPQEYGAKTKGWHKPAFLLLCFIAALRDRFVHLPFRVKSAFACGFNRLPS